MKVTEMDCYVCGKVVPVDEMIPEKDHLFCSQPCVDCYYEPHRNRHINGILRRVKRSHGDY